MTQTEIHLAVLEEAYCEAKIAFEGLADAHVWKRPAEGLLSIGELAGHIAYWEAIRLAGEDRDDEADLAKCRVSSPLIDNQFRYYPAILATPLSEEHRAMTAEAVCGELLRVHNEAMAFFKTLNPDLNASLPGLPPNFTYRAVLMYAGFHVAYHTGQIYTVRHLLGDKTPDN